MTISVMARQGATLAYVVLAAGILAARQFGLLYGFLELTYGIIEVLRKLLFVLLASLHTVR